MQRSRNASPSPPCVFGAALGSIEFTRSSGSIAAFWPANAIVVAALLRDSRSSAKHRCSVVLGAFAGLVLAKLAARDGVLLSIALPMASVAEITAAVWLVNRFVGNPIDLRRPRSLVLFMLLVSGVAPIAGATIGAAMVSAAHWLPWSSTWPVWYAADALGMVIVAPFALSLNAGQWRELHFDKRVLAALSVLGPVVLVAILAGYYRQFLFVVVPVILFAIMRFGVAGGATATFVVGFICSVFPIKGWGAPPVIASEFFRADPGVADLSGGYLALVLAGRRRARRARPLAQRAISGNSARRSHKRIEIQPGPCSEAALVEWRNMNVSGLRASS